MRRIFVVEPHSDDAFLSLGGHIEQWIEQGRKVTILTLVPVKKNSLPNAQEYAARVGADWRGFSFLGGNTPWSLYKPPVKPWPPEHSRVVLPLGVAPLDQTEHTQDHWNIRKWLQYPGCWYYLDQPYAIVQKHRERVNDFLRGMQVVSYVKPSAQKWRHIPIFTAQSKFFFYNPEEKLRQTVELIVRSPSLRFPRLVGKPAPGGS